MERLVGASDQPLFGLLAQPVEHHHGMVGVTGSIPVESTAAGPVQLRYPTHGRCEVYAWRRKQRIRRRCSTRLCAALGTVAEWLIARSC